MAPELKRYFPEDDTPQIAVMGPHSSGTKLHFRIAEQLNEAAGSPWHVIHASTPRGLYPVCERYIWVQRDPTITMLSQRKHGLGQDMSDVWEGISEGTYVLSKIGKPTLAVWYQDTVRSLRTVWIMADFMGVDVERAYDVAHDIVRNNPIYNGDLKYHETRDELLRY